MKIFFHEACLMNLKKFGIEIPWTDERSLKTYEYLLSLKIPVDTSFLKKHSLTEQDVGRAHSPDYLKKLYGSTESLRGAIIDTFELINEEGHFHRFDPQSASLPLEDLWQRVEAQTSGTMAAVQAALEHGEAYFLGGGFHHAMSFGGRGFCVINDIIIAARWAQENFQKKCIWVIDVDAHKGDGTAEIAHSDSSIKTLSIHMKEGWPLDSSPWSQEGKLNPWFIPSDVEIGIAPGEENFYLDELSKGLKQLQEITIGTPDLAIVVQGSDPYEKDQLPSSSHLKLSKEQMLQRDLLVYDFLKSRNIPQAYVMSGGYGEFAYEIYCQFLEKVAGKKA